MLDLNPNLRSRSQRGYDRLARVYSATEWLVFGNQLQTARVALVDELPPWNHLLVFGDGNGRLIERLCVRRRSFVQQASGHWLGKIVSLDHSPAMLRRQQSRVARIGAGEHIEFMHADAFRFPLQAGLYDVVVTPFFLDCFSASELELHLPRWLSALHTGGVLYHVDFTIPQRHWQRARAKLLLKAMHLFFGWTTGLRNRQLVDTQHMIQRSGFEKQAERIGAGGMIVTQVWRRGSVASFPA